MGRLRQVLQNRRCHEQPQQHAPARPAGGALQARCAGSAPASEPAPPQAATPPAEPSQAAERSQNAAPAQAAEPKGGSGWSLGGFADRIGKALRPEVKPEEKEAIDRMIGVMPELAGADGRFNRGDLEPIRESLQPELRGVVDGEIQRRAQERVDQARPIARPLVRMGARAHLRKHGDEYRAMGMQQGNDQIRGGLSEAFDRMGDQTRARDGDGQRKLTLDDLRRFGQDAQVLEAISRRSQEKGLPRFEFPKGMSAEDLAAIREGRLPPNGVPVFRSQK